MAVTQVNYTGNGSTTNYSFTFPYLEKTDVKVRIDGTIQDTTAYSFANATTIAMDTAPANGAKVVILRDTNIDSKKGTFYAGSAIKAEDLNDNYDQVLYTVQEIDNNAMTTDGTTPMTGDFVLGEDLSIVFEGATDDAYETTLSVADPTADRTITLPNVTGTVITTGDSGTVTSAMIADATIVAGDIANTTITGSKLVNSTITSTQLAASAVTENKLADSAVANAKLGGSAVTTNKIADDAITTAKVVDNAITTAKIAANAITGGKINNGSVDTSELADDAVTSDKIADNAILTTHLAADAVETADIKDGAVTTDKIASSNVTAATIATGAVVEAKIGAAAVTEGKIANNAVTTAKIADAELTTLAGMQSGTASKLADSTALTADIAELNLLDGKSIVTAVSGSSSDDQLPTAKAVNDQILSVTNALGGFVAIANETSFPATNPDPSNGAGTTVSISDAGGIQVNSSGQASITNGAGSGNTVTINGFPSALRGGATVDGVANANPYVITSGTGLQVQTTSTLHTYDYHKVLINEEDANKLSGDIQDFQERYRVAASAPTSSKDDGDLWFDTTNNKMKVYNASGSSWDDVAAPGNFFINTISSSSGTGGGSATFNGTAYRFTLSSPPSQGAQQLIISINGVIQKPNSGTSQPAEGFAVDTNDVIFSAAPPSGSDYFIITLGNTVNIGTPSDNTVATAKIQNLAVTTAKIAADAVTGAKIADDAVGAEHIEALDDELQFGDDVKAQFGAGNDIEIFHKSSDQSAIIQNVNDTGFLRILSGDSNSSGILLKNRDDDVVYIRCKNELGTEIFHENNVKFETISAGVKITGNNLILNDSGAFFIDHPTTGQVVNFRVSNSSSNDTTALTLLSDGMNSHADNIKSAWGTGNDLQIYHDGTRNIIDAATSKNTDFYYGGAQQFWFGNAEFKGIDNKKIILGTGDDLQIYHDGTSSYLANSNGTLMLTSTAGNNIRIRSDNIRLQSITGPEDYLRAEKDGAVELYYDDSKKCYTGPNGLKFDDNDKALFGNSSDLEIYHSGSDSFIKDAGTGRLLLLGSEVDLLKSDGGEYLITSVEDGAVSLYYDGVKKFETASNGIAVSGQVDCTAGGVLVDDNYSFSAGDSGDLLIFHNGSHSYIHQDGTGALKILADTFRVNNEANDEHIIKGDNGGSVELYYDNSLKAKTYADGLEVRGDFWIDNQTNAGKDIWFDESANTFKYSDNVVASWGTSNDLLIYHDGSDNFIHNNVAGYHLRITNSDNSDAAVFYNGGAVNLYYADGTKKFETTGSGITVQGSVTESSDVALKTNITPIDNVLDKIQQITGYTYQFKDTGHDSMGVTAQDVEKVFPELVHGEEGVKTLQYSGLIGALIESVKELSNKVAALEAK